jgi:hypothetical protein
MGIFHRGSTTRYQAYVTPPDAREGDYSRATTYYFEAEDYWEAKRMLNNMFGNRWENLTEAR